ncbi:lysM domain-containing GPI-anchored protein 1-like [Cicer arietinum]|uniref:LysM domain-containing GPI-anchored protein 1-like n=1 Tax=Cicer arietinum TaxID=3827 RepID=A0A1S2Y7D6_CICAR|nr:lysM domain-containing GPI-anchored protein 1-like [Cicer arietinum]XP_027190774.1 lysM domain-containing GPI-anchored protein 1-like [Cicer arietinum]
MHKTTLSIFLLFQALLTVTSKSTIEPCTNSDTCNALLGYTLYTDLKVSEVSSLFQIDPISLLTANAIDISYPDVEHHILPSKLYLKIPISCSCVDGIRKSVSTNYKIRPSDTLSTIADSVYGGLVSSDQLKEANSINDPSVLDVGQNLVVPLPCTCFNGSDNSLPAIYLSYVVQPLDSLAAIAARYFTTLTDLMNDNAMGTTAISDGDILAIPIPACASNFPKYASDFGLLVPNGSYAITAGHCVQCSCGPRNLNLYCMPASLAVSCSSMQCKNSNLMLGNVTVQQTGGGCNVTSCSYDGIVNGTIATTLNPSLQPRCPGQQEFPPLIAPPTSVEKESEFAPAPSPSSQSDGTGGRSPTSSVVPSTGISGFTPANGPISGISSGASAASSLVKPLPTLTPALVLLLVKLMIPVAL